MEIVWLQFGDSVVAMGVWGERLKAISGEDIAFRVSELTSY